MRARAALEASPGALVDVAAAPGHDVRMLESAATAFEAMAAAARDDGVGLVAVSGFRDVERQVGIWNHKFEAGRRDGLDDAAAVARVLEYSAPPGWSRHHWGSDVDLVQDSLLHAPRLEEADWDVGAVCAAAADWLGGRARDFGFVRPYDVYRGGYRPEPWHWSFAPAAVPRLIDLARIDWRAWLETAPFLAADVVLADVERLYERFCIRIAPALIG